MCDYYSFYDSITYAKLPDDIKKMAKRCLLDTLGVAIAGSQTEMSKAAIQTAKELYGPTETHSAELLFHEGADKVSVPAAAMAGAFTIDSFDAHDGINENKGHASCTILPSLLAWASDLKQSGDGGRLVDGETLLTAFVLACESANRFGLRMHQQCTEYHTSGAWCAIGVAGACAWLSGMPRAQLRHALGIAEYGGPLSHMMRCIDHPTMVKDGAGFGAFIGTMAAHMASHGFTGAPATTVEAEPAEADYGSRWELLRTFFKPYPVCRWAQPALSALEEILARDPKFDYRKVVEVRVATFHNAVRLGSEIPASTEEAQYAIAWPLAALLVKGKLTVTEINTAAFADADIIAMCKKVRLSESDYCNEQFPRQFYADVEVVLENGQTMAHRSIAKGDPDYPMTNDEIRVKFTKLVTPVLGIKKQVELMEFIDNIEVSNDITEIFVHLY